MGKVVVLAAIWASLVLGFWGSIIFVAAHFIGKFW